MAQQNIDLLKATINFEPPYQVELVMVFMVEKLTGDFNSWEVHKGRRQSNGFWCKIDGKEIEMGMPIMWCFYNDFLKAQKLS